MIEGKSHPDFDELATFSYSYGHTIGLIIAKIHAPDKTVAFVSDLIPGLAWMHLPVVMGYDRYPELTVNEKREFLEEAEAGRYQLFFTHDPQASFVSVHLDEKGRYFGR